jgi:hypothetical protein
VEFKGSMPFAEFKRHYPKVRPAADKDETYLPQDIETRGFDESTVVWGLGLLAFFCVTGRFPSDGPKDKRLEQQIELAEDEWAGVPERLVEVCRKMVARAPQDRPKLMELKIVLEGLV